MSWTRLEAFLKCAAFVRLALHAEGRRSAAAVSAPARFENFHGVVDSRGKDGSQEDVYKILGRRQVDNVLGGINCCLFASPAHVGRLFVGRFQGV